MDRSDTSTRVLLLLSILLCVLALGGTYLTSWANGIAELTAGSSSGDPGDTNIEIPVSLAADPEVSGLNFDLSFDDSRLSFSHVAAGPAATSANKSVSSSTPSLGTIRVIVFGVNQIAISDGLVVTIVFDIKSDASPGSIPLPLSNAAVTAPDGSGVDVKTTGGSLTVNSPPATVTPTHSPTGTPLPTNTSAPTVTPVPSNTASPTEPKVTPSGQTATASSTTPVTITATISYSESPTSTPDETADPAPTGTGTPTPEPGNTAETTGPAPTEHSTSTELAMPSMAPEDKRALEAAVKATATSLAKFEFAVASTATALGQRSVSDAETKDDPSERGSPTLLPSPPALSLDRILDVLTTELLIKFFWGLAGVGLLGIVALLLAFFLS